MQKFNELTEQALIQEAKLTTYSDELDELNKAVFFKHAKRPVNSARPVDKKNSVFYNFMQEASDLKASQA